MTTIAERVARAIAMFYPSMREADYAEPVAAILTEIQRTHAIVPREPSENIKAAANNAFFDAPYKITCGDLGARIYAVMLAAAPDPANTAS
jgi:hypothetical protein